jgi:hypothetical protein
MAVATGELIRAMNYVEDITATLRRICIYIPAMSPAERKRLAETMRAAAASFNAAIGDSQRWSRCLGSDDCSHRAGIWGVASRMLQLSADTVPFSRTCFQDICARRRPRSAPISTRRWN